MHLIAFSILSVFTMALFLMTLFSSLAGEFFLFPVLLFLSVLLVFSMQKEFKNELKRLKNSVASNSFPVLLVTVAGALLSYILNVYLGLGAVVAASVVGLVGASLVKKYAVPIYCGSFVGMVSPEVLHDFTHVLLASFIAGVLYILAQEVYKGVGGKLGAIAFSSWVLLSMFSDVELITGSSISFRTGLYIFIYSIAGVLLTHVLSVRLDRNIVASSSAVSLIAGLVFPVVYSDSGSTIAAATMCASFVGMSSKKILRHEFDALLSGAMMGIFFLMSVEHFGGAGGKLGTIAFGSALSLKGLRDFWGIFK
ncbi:hypothetical protein AT15_06075 [Kosmotoga arenicorallina S304]|uniref:Uncharacterized protein n=1 Tax=Kosmotoga arenicorallina S304 TaxID=1453497 RepID=A0A182C7M9_9BACT|nr:hypothetical protein [Kosmotoga arenicorallina]OAA31638.1 hypothetical protein AT15_06075 [Kosmotoga arenicorallina S304]